MTLRRSLTLARAAARANFLPGVLLQVVLVAFLAAYTWHDGTRLWLEHIAAVKRQEGFRFAFVVYAIAAAILPELLRMFLLQRGRATRRNLFDLMTGIPLWGAWGLIVDVFYRLQVAWFGDGHDFQTVAVKVAVDQLLFSPFFGMPLLAAVFGWRDAGFSWAAVRAVFTRSFVFERVFPVQVAGWLIWVPAVSLVYFMPGALQVPVAALIQCFWVLMFTFISRPASRP